MNTNLPNIVTSLTDGNLNTRDNINLGDRIILLGTAARGPMNTATSISSPAEAQSIFGSVSSGTLVRGYTEAYYAPGGPKDIRLVRIGNGEKASLELDELTGSGVLYASVDTTTSVPNTSVTIEARDPGEIFNEGSIRQEVVNGQLSAVFYNPVTGLETIIPYDPAGLVDNSVSDAAGLVNALNLDTNFASHFEASVENITSTMTLTLDDTQAFITATGNYAYPSGTITLDLADALDTADTDKDGLTEDTSIVTSDTPVTAGNRLVTINEAYAKENLLVELETAGLSSVTLDYPVQVTNGVADDFLELDLTADATYDGRAKHVFVGTFIGTGDGETTAFSFTAYEPIDGSTLTVYRTGPSGTPVEVSGVAVTQAGGSGSDYVATLTLPAAPPTNHVVTASYTTIEFPLTKVSTLTALSASNSYRTYYAAGNKLYFGAAQPADIQLAYKARKTFGANDINISDAVNGLIEFSNLENLPNIWLAAGVDVYLSVTYQPEYPDLTGGAQSLTGGTNGITMTNAEKYDALDDAYTALADTPADIIVPISTYIDDTKTDYDTETGVEITVNAGFAEQLNAHCVQLLDGVSETFGVIAVKPIVPADGRSVKAADITTWITDLTTYSYSDVTRAANVMNSLDAKHLDVVAIEPVFSNATVRVPYTTSGECLYAGMIAKLPSNSAATNKALSGIVGLRYTLSARQLNTLVGARYVCAMNRPDLGIVVADGVTAAATTSDWKRRSTWRIMVEAMRGVRQVGQAFIGEGFSGARKAALDTAIMRYLDGMKSEGKLNDFDWSVTQTRAQEVNGTASVRLVLYPAFELRRLEVTVELRNS